MLDSWCVHSPLCRARRCPGAVRRERRGLRGMAGDAGSTDGVLHERASLSDAHTGVARLREQRTTSPRRKPIIAAPPPERTQSAARARRLSPRPPSWRRVPASAPLVVVPTLQRCRNGAHSFRFPARPFPSISCSPSCSSSQDSRRVSARTSIPGRWRCRACARAAVTSVCSMINRLIELSLQNRVHRGRPVPRARRLGLVGARRDADRRHSRPLRQPGDRLHRLAGPQPAGSRGPGHLSADGQPAGARRRARRALAVGVRLLDDLRRSSRTTSTCTSRARACSSA